MTVKHKSPHTSDLDGIPTVFAVPSSIPDSMRNRDVISVQSRRKRSSPARLASNKLGPRSEISYSAISAIYGAYDAPQI
jgi:hypothetical protein